MLSKFVCSTLTQHKPSPSSDPTTSRTMSKQQLSSASIGATKHLNRNQHGRGLTGTFMVLLLSVVLTIMLLAGCAGLQESGPPDDQKSVQKKDIQQEQKQGSVKQGQKQDSAGKKQEQSSQKEQQKGSKQQAQNEKAKNKTESSIDHTKIERARATAKQVNGVTEVAAVALEQDLSVAVEVAQLKRLQLRQIRKDIFHALRKRYPDMTLHVTTDRKIFSEMEKLEKKAYEENPDIQGMKQTLQKLNEDMRG